MGNAWVTLSQCQLDLGHKHILGAGTVLPWCWCHGFTTSMVRCLRGTSSRTCRVEIHTCICDFIPRRMSKTAASDSLVMKRCCICRSPYRIDLVDFFGVDAPVDLSFRSTTLSSKTPTAGAKLLATRNASHRKLSLYLRPLHTQYSTFTVLPWCWCHGTSTPQLNTLKIIGKIMTKD
jgi:hypothetical protein